MRGLVCVLIVLLAFACNGGEEGLRTATPAPPPSATLAVTPMATALPQIAYAGADGAIWLANADGTGSKKLIEGGGCPDKAALVWSLAGITTAYSCLELGHAPCPTAWCSLTWKAAS